jgi:hypothetical protein
MTPPDLREVFVASAGVAGALIGLLFVAISVSRERLDEEVGQQAHRVRALAALTSFTNALAISLFALVPDVGLGWPSVSVGVSGLLFVIASLLSVRRVREAEPTAPRDVAFLVGLIIIFAFQLYLGLRVAIRTTDFGAARGIAILIIVCFLVGIARSWELIGGPSIGIGGEMRELLGRRRPPPGGPAR